MHALFHEMMKQMLETRGYEPTNDQLDELVEIYEDCQEWNENGEMITGLTFEEVEDFIKHSSEVDRTLSSQKKKDPVLCGFIWCHGNKDFSIWETNAITKEDRDKIEEILSKYDTEGSSERNVYERIKDLVSEEY